MGVQVDAASVRDWVPPHTGHDPGRARSPRPAGWTLQRTVTHRVEPTGYMALSSPTSPPKQPCLPFAPYDQRKMGQSHQPPQSEVRPLCLPLSQGRPGKSQWKSSYCIPGSRYRPQTRIFPCPLDSYPTPLATIPTICSHSPHSGSTSLFGPRSTPVDCTTRRPGAQAWLRGPQPASRSGQGLAWP